MYILLKEVEGQECGRCTLVNPPHARTCEACSATLGVPPIIPARKRV
jgi:ribosomal protein L40E